MALDLSDCEPEVRTRTYAYYLIVAINFFLLHAFFLGLILVQGTCAQAYYYLFKYDTILFASRKCQSFPSLSRALVLVSTSKTCAQGDDEYKLPIVLGSLVLGGIILDSPERDSSM